MREEKEIFEEFAKLCSSPGYIHVIAHFCFRDNTVSYSDELTPDDMMRTFSVARLIRTEVSTLLGLMLKETVDFGLPEMDVLGDMIEKTELLLEELHQAMNLPMRAWVSNLSEPEQSDVNPFMTGSFLREPIFYGGESAYPFQYRDFATKKYIKDNRWLKENKGFSIEDAKTVILTIAKIQKEKIFVHLKSLSELDPKDWTMLPAFVFSIMEVVELSKLEKKVVDKILQAFVSPAGKCNQEFNELHDFNVANAAPLIKLDNDQYLSFQYLSLTEALYDSPFYWMRLDENYINQAMDNRGDFTEEFSAERLKLVFGQDRVFSNIKIIGSKKKIVDEIDVLVVFAGRAIVLQAKSKKLRLDARKGNDNCIKDDFKKSIQHSYDQGMSCAKSLTDKNYKLVDTNSNEIHISRIFKQIYIFCVVSDHYPALSFQARQFLKYEQTDVIKPPFITDIFTLDVMTEMLQSPLYFLGYIDRRTEYFEKVSVSHETTTLAYHLKQNLWIEDENTFFCLDDTLRSELDAAMIVRREGIPGKSTPNGILTRFQNTVLGNLIKEIEKLEKPVTVDLGLMLLTLGEETMLQLNDGLEHIINSTKKDRKHHDLTFGIGGGSTGITIHCNDDPIDVAKIRLQAHCENRKYTEKANNWFGICVNPDNGSPKFGIELNYVWKKSQKMDALVKDLPKGQKKLNFGHFKKTTKIGRNEPCPCGSSIKFKKCCFNKY